MTHCEPDWGGDLSDRLASGKPALESAIVTNGLLN